MTEESEHSNDKKIPDALHVHEDPEEVYTVPPGARVIMHPTKDPELERLIVEVKSGIRAQREAEDGPEPAA